MIGPSGGSGPGWYYKGKHYDEPQALHEAMNAELDRLELQIDELRKWAEKGKAEAMAFLNASRPNPDDLARHQMFSRGAVFGALLDKLTISEKRVVPVPKCEKPFRPGENTEGRRYAMMTCGRDQGHDGPCGCA